MIYRYLFKDDHNSHFATYKPFTSNRLITQDLADKFSLIHNPAAGRVGSSINDLYSVATGEGYDIKLYKCEYTEDEKYREDYDPLPESFKEWPIICCISGNY